MHDSVQTGFRNELALEHIIPVCNGKLAGQDECLPVVPVIYDLFKVMLYLAVQLDHPKVIDNQQVMCVQLRKKFVSRPSRCASFRFSMSMFIVKYSTFRPFLHALSPRAQAK